MNFSSGELGSTGSVPYPFDLPPTDGKTWGPLDANLQYCSQQVVAATGDSAVMIDRGPNWRPTPFEEVTLALDISAIKTSHGDETYEAEVYESMDGANWATTGLYVTPTATGVIVKALGITCRYSKLTFTLGGTAPTMTLDAYLIPPVRS